MIEDEKYIGKFRGIVIDNLDPEKRGRLLLEVPDVLGETPTTWAEACIPLSGPKGSPMGFYLLPPVGAGVWVEFEQGDVNYPIWVGCRWGKASDLPPLSQKGKTDSPNIVLQSQNKNILLVSDVSGKDGGILIKSQKGASIVVNDNGIVIDNGKGANVELKGSTVNINKGAFEVT